MHREMGRVDNEPDKDGAIQAMVPNVEKFNLRYLDPSAMNGLKNGTPQERNPNRLPRAVELMLVVEEDPTDPGEMVRHDYITTVIIDRPKDHTLRYGIRRLIGWRTSSAMQRMMR